MYNERYNPRCGDNGKEWVIYQHFFGINLIYLSTMVLTIQSMGGEME
jgi:hypothetical protein